MIPDREPGEGLGLAIGGYLISRSPGEAQVPGAEVEGQPSLQGADAVLALEAQQQVGGIGSGMEYDIGFEARSVAIEMQVYVIGDLGVDDAVVARDIGDATRAMSQVEVEVILFPAPGRSGRCRPVALARIPAPGLCGSWCRW